MKQKSTNNGPQAQDKLVQEKHQNFSQPLRFSKESNSQAKFLPKEFSPPKEANSQQKLSVPDSPAVGASRSFANVAKSGSQGKTASLIDVEIYTKEVTKNEVQISGA